MSARRSQSAPDRDGTGFGGYWRSACLPSAGRPSLRTISYQRTRRRIWRETHRRTAAGIRHWVPRKRGPCGNRHLLDRLNRLNRSGRRPVLTKIVRFRPRARAQPRAKVSQAHIPSGKESDFGSDRGQPADRVRPSATSLGGATHLCCRSCRYKDRCPQAIRPLWARPASCVHGNGFDGLVAFHLMHLPEQGLFHRGPAAGLD